ncbi:hypothetical protein JCM8097_000833 [Rhodosporidiobolus ruineniae]
MVAAPLPPPPPRRVSYVLPPPAAPPPLLSLPPLDIPRRGVTNPLYSFSSSSITPPSHKYAHEHENHPRHRLAVQALALDLSTSLSHNGELDSLPGGILYTGGRDGLLCSWELGLPTRRRKKHYGQSEEDEEDSSADEAVDSADEDDAEAVGALELDDLESRPVANKAKPRRASSQRRRASGSSTATTKQFDRRGSAATAEALPVSERWEVDPDAVENLKDPPKAKFRQCIQSHTDWVNDIVLCNYNRTLVSASSDSLVLAWSPHSSDHHDQVTPTPIGRHGDYVRCLATPRDSHWVASGGFDRKIKLWDVGEGRSGDTPLLELPSPPASVYSLGTTSSGSLIAAGTPERVVRVWDPRSRKQVSRLGGHTDNIRAVLLADDGKWLLSASSDSTVKLWSLAAQKCLHTFSHHAASVWSLFSQHPTLEIFYSGDRAGNLCKIDLEGTGDPGEGECIVLARDGPDDDDERRGHEGITQLVAQDDSWVWTASGSSSVKRWKDVPPKARRMGAILKRARENGEGIVPEEPRVESPISSEAEPRRSIDSPNPSFPSSSPSSPERDRPAAFSVSFLEGLTTPLGRTSSSPTPRSPANAAHLASSGRPSSLRTPRQSLTSGQRPPLDQLVPASFNPTTLVDIPYDALVPLVQPEDEFFAPTFHRYRDPDAATIYSTVSGTSAPGLGLGSLHRPHLVSASSSSFRRPHSIADLSHDATNIAQRDYLERESAAEATPLRSEPDDVIEGGYGLVRCALLNDRQHALTQDTEDQIALWNVVRGTCIGIFARDELQDALAKRRPSDAATSSILSASSWKAGERIDVLEYVRERIEGEVSIATWCRCDTRTGSLTIHLEQARVFDAEAYIDECGVGPAEDFPPDHRLYLGKWVLRRLFDGFVEAEMAQRMPNASPPPTQSALFGADGPANPAPAFISLAGLSSPRAKGPRTPGMTIALATPAIKRAVLPDLPTASATSPRFGTSELQPIPQSPLVTDGALATGGKTPTMERPEGDYFSLRPTVTEAPSSAPIASPSAASASPAPTPGLSTPLPTPGGNGTLMGRLKMLGKGSKRSTAPAETPTVLEPIQPVVKDDRPLEERQQQQILDNVFSRPLTPCPNVDAPPIFYDPDMAVIISEEAGDAWSVKYRGLVGTSFEDMAVLEQKAPFWLLDFLLGNRILMKEPPKVSFVLQPWRDPKGHTLPDLPNANARLTANRCLRVRKVCSYVADKLDLRRPSRAPSIMDGASRPPSLYGGASASVGQTLYGDFDPEREIEILVNDQVLPVNVTLSTIRHCMWKSGGDVVLQYRAVHAGGDEEEE